MNKSAIFSAAHKRASKYAKNFSSYRKAFSAALKAEYAIAKEDVSFSKLDIWKHGVSGEIRFYFTYTDGTQGCYYRDGNAWNPKGKKDNCKGFKTALAIMAAKAEGRYRAVYSNEMYF